MATPCAGKRYQSTALDTVHRISLSGLCIGGGYDLTITDADVSGAEAQIYVRRTLPLTNTYTLTIPQIRPEIDGLLQVDVSQDGNLYRVTASHLNVYPSSYIPGVPTGAELWWRWDSVEWDRLGAAGWTPLFGRDICGAPNPETMVLQGTGLGLLPQGDLILTARVEVREAVPRGTDGACLGRDLVTECDFTTTVHLADLLAGVEITSPDGLVNLRVRIPRYERS
ncbi:MAG: hypothetical protein WEE53_01330 [Acidimicrobiia bacterium]